MSSDLLSIAASGARAAKSALDVTAQNIANAATEGYVRRTSVTSEVATAGGMLRLGDISLSGVRVEGIARNADQFRVAQVRRSQTDLSRASTELDGLKGVESAIEQANVYDSIVGVEASLRGLSTDPSSLTRRGSVIASLEGLASSFNIAAGSLDAVEQQLTTDTSGAVDEANRLGSELARLNLGLTRAGDGSAERASLLDQRDLMLEQLARVVDVSVVYAPTGAVTVTVGDASGTPLVQGGLTNSMAMIANPGAAPTFSIGGTPVTASGGKLAGGAAALVQVGAARAALDGLAADVAGAINGAQAAGSDLSGAPGSPLLSGTTAKTLALATRDGAAIAAAAAGAGANSLDGSNLLSLSSTLERDGFAERMSQQIYAVSNMIAGREVTRTTLGHIADAAKSALQTQAGVDLDNEAANLVRFQQAFQASGRAMQVASDIFDTLLGIG